MERIMLGETLWDNFCSFTIRSRTGLQDALGRILEQKWRPCIEFAGQLMDENNFGVETLTRNL